MTGADTAAAAPQPRASRRMRIALIASLAFNLLLIGAIGGSIWAFRHHAPWALSGVNAHLLGFTRTLPAERKFAIWQATREERRALRPLRKAVRAARAEARQALLAQPFDKQKLAAAQMRVLDAEVIARRASHQLFVAVADVLTPDERAAFARWRPPPGWRSKRYERRDESVQQPQSYAPASTSKP
jgi:uncharacterized membrane protein